MARIHVGDTVYLLVEATVVALPKPGDEDILVSPKFVQKDEDWVSRDRIRTIPKH